MKRIVAVTWRRRSGACAKGCESAGRGGKAAGSRDGVGRAIEPASLPREGVSDCGESLDFTKERKKQSWSDRKHIDRTRVRKSTSHFGRVTETSEARHPRNWSEDNALQQTGSSRCNLRVSAEAA